MTMLRTGVFGASKSRAITDVLYLDEGQTQHVLVGPNGDAFRVSDIMTLPLATSFDSASDLLVIMQDGALRLALQDSLPL